MATTLFVSDYPYLIAVVLLSPGASANNVSVFPDVKYNSSESLWVLNLIEDLQYRIYYSEEQYSGPSDAITESSGGVSYEEVSGSILIDGLPSSSYPNVIAIVQVFSSGTTSTTISVYKSGNVWKASGSIYSNKTYGVYYFQSSDAITESGGTAIQYKKVSAPYTVGSNEMTNIIGVECISYPAVSACLIGYVARCKESYKDYDDNDNLTTYYSYYRRIMVMYCYGDNITDMNYSADVRVYYY